MKRIGNLFEKIVDIDNIRKAEIKAKRGKAKQRGVKRHLENREENLWKIKAMLEYRSFTTSPYHTFTIFEGKERTISSLPFYPDGIVHHVVLNVLEPLFIKTFTADTFSCIKGRGVHAASYKLRNYLKDAEGTKYCLKLDIRKFYQSVDKSILKGLLRKKFKDRGVLWLLDDVIDSYEEGLPLGSYTSQFLANFYLTYFDHWVKEVLRIKYFQRYCDDFVILSDSKEELHTRFQEIKKYLGDNLKLEVKSNHQIFPVESRGIDWVGFRHYHTHVLLRKSIKQKYKKNPIKMNHNSWLAHCNSVNLRNKYERNVTRPIQ